MKITITIPQPCDESWDAMRPVSGGRHCESCAKTVVDLSRYSDEELVHFFTRESTAGACCRLRDDQLKRTLALPPETKLRSRIWRRAAAVVIATQLLVTEAVAQGSKRAYHTVRSIASSDKSQQRFLKGRITGDRRPWKDGAVTFLLGDSASIIVVPDTNGRFRIPLPSGFRTGTLSWKMQEVAGGYILKQSVPLDDRLLAKGLELAWLSPAIVDAAIVTRQRQYVPPVIDRHYGGLPAVHYYETPKKRSFIQRVFGRSRNQS